MKVNTEKLLEVLTRLGSRVHGSCCEAAVTVGAADGVVYRVVAMDTAHAEDEDCESGPPWAMCITGAQENNDE